MKKKWYLFIIITVASVLCGCGEKNVSQNDNGNDPEIQAEEQEEDLPEENPNSTGEQEGDLPEENPNSTGEQETVYIGEYLDDNGDPNLEIAKGEDDKYIVQIGIFRLTSLEDGVGELTVDGMMFTATDAAGNPISGVITVKDGVAKVTFTDSTWTYLENGATYEYIKSSETPNLWGE